MMFIIMMMFMHNGGIKTVDAAKATGSYNYVCVANTSIAGKIDINMKVNPSISLPDSVEPNGEFIVKDIISAIEIDLTGNLDFLRPLINPFNGHVNHFNLVANGQSVNAVGESGVKIPETPHNPEDSYIPFTVSGIDSKFTAGEEDTEIHVGEIEAVINAKLVATPVDLTVVCTPQGETLLATVYVEEADEVAPVITIHGDNPLELEVGQEYVEPGATATDDVDGDVTDSIVISGEVNTDLPGKYEVVYTVTDTAGNEAKEIRIVNVVDKTAPVITLKGDNPLELEVGQEYVEPGATATDNVDGDVTELIKISGEVNTEEPGEYEVVYTVSDAAGNRATETRIVHVVETEDPGDGNGEDPGDGDNGEDPGDGNGEEPGDGDNGEDPGDGNGEETGGTWFTGEGAPQPTQGNKGDLYLDTDTFDIYEKTDEDWQLIGNLKGEDGQDGIDGVTWLIGEGAPGVNVGNYGDLYLDTISGDIYIKSEEGWEQVGNLQGPPGEDGEDGKDGADGKDGEDGKDGADGKDGEDGKDGADGQDGEDGKDGADGKDGEDGKDGADGKDGEDGKDGADGKDGEDGKDGADGKDGEDGKDGADGKDGEDGKDGSDGKDGEDGKDGADGQDGEDGTDGKDGEDKTDGKSSIESNGDDTNTKIGNKGVVPTGSSKERASGSGSILPKTATNNPLLLTLGVVLLLVGGTVVFMRKKKEAKL
ncbi:immunoglobulin-like domain-containing protein [Pseudogracilibacillus sp. SO30301A]|uniref:immunoglobulin-like domain-containing protein n=1 Tax=Pseudogracilibacillus sp. SO30301A TaxID=3098291 RepID=UPI00300E274E